jgi:hypothetical protein
VPPNGAQFPEPDRPRHSRRFDSENPGGFANRVVRRTPGVDRESTHREKSFGYVDFIDWLLISTICGRV